MYTMERLEKTDEEWKIGTQTVVDALITAYQYMDCGAIETIKYTIATIDRYNRNCPAIEGYDTVIDFGAIISIDSLMDVSYHEVTVDCWETMKNESNVRITWTNRSGSTITDLLLPIHYDATSFSFPQILDNIEVDLGDDCGYVSLMTWYADHCSKEIYDDITNEEAQEFDN